MARKRKSGGEMDNAKTPDEEVKEEEKEAEHAAGGAVQARKRGGAINGAKPGHRPDKRARGGKIMTPKSPMSGAAPTKMRPGFGENKTDKSDD